MVLFGVLMGKLHICGGLGTVLDDLKIIFGVLDMGFVDLIFTDTILAWNTYTCLCRAALCDWYLVIDSGLYPDRRIYLDGYTYYVVWIRIL